jgi:hypothetical protein
MPSKGISYGIGVVLVAVLLINSTLTLMFYGEYQQEVSENQRHIDELNSALKDYHALTNNYNGSLRGFNSTLSLLANAVSSLNTTTSAYKAASSAISSLWESYQSLALFNDSRILTYKVHMLIDFGNESTKWYNSTSIEPGWNAYVASVVLLDGRVQATWYPQYNEHFVEGIDGRPSGRSTSWFVWAYDNGSWQASPTGADGIQVYNDTVFAWTLCGYDASFNPTCTP